MAEAGTYESEHFDVLLNSIGEDGGVEGGGVMLLKLARLMLNDDGAGGSLSVYECQDIGSTPQISKLQPHHISPYGLVAALLHSCKSFPKTFCSRLLPPK